MNPFDQTSRVAPKQSIVLHGTGPSLHITTPSTSKMIVVTKNRAQSLKMRGATDVKFASAA